MHNLVQPPSFYCEYSVEPRVIEKSCRIGILDSVRRFGGIRSEHRAEVLMGLVSFIKPKTVVEVGVFGCEFLLPMAYALKELGVGIVYGQSSWNTVFSVDGFEEDLLSDVEDKIRHFKLGQHVHLGQSHFNLVQSISNIDVLYIDRNQSNEVSFANTVAWTPRVRRGGMIVFDEASWCDMKKSTDWLDECCVRMPFRQCGDDDWAIWVKS